MLQEGQLKYPVPEIGEEHAQFMKRFEEFLDKHGKDIGVMLFEPQWGSSVASTPWPPQLLRAYVTEAKRRGLAVICDEVMCGLGRHGMTQSRK